MPEIWAPNAFLIDTCQDIDEKWLDGVKTVALTAGASAPEILVQEVITFLGNKGFSSVQEVEVMPEHVRFATATGDCGRNRGRSRSARVE